MNRCGISPKVLQTRAFNRSATRPLTVYITFSICVVLFAEILCGLVELHGVAVVWLAESVDEAVCLLDDDS